MASGSIAGVSYAGQYFYFNWSSSYHSPGVSLISWRLSGQGGSSYWYNSQCYLNINNSRVYNRSLQSTYFKNNTFTSGSFYVYHNSSGVAYFNADVISSIYNWKLYTRSNSWNIYGNYPYTSCGAPSSVSITETDGEVKPGEQIISWSAGSAGTANNVKGYGILIGKNYIPTTSKYDDYFEVGNVLSAKRDVSEYAGRGDTIYATVRTHGTAGGSYYSGASNAYGSAHVINHAISPDIIIEKNRLTSEETTGTFFLSAIGSSAKAIQYKINDGEWNGVAEGEFIPLELAEGKMKEITVRAKNSLGEWNDEDPEHKYKKARIMRNSKPVITINKITTNSYEGENRFNFEGEEKTAIIADYHYETNFNLTPGKFSLGEQSYINVYCKSEDGKKFQLNISDDLKETPLSGQKKKPFKIYYEYYDGVEFADTKESINWYVLPSPPTKPTPVIINGIKNEKGEEPTENYLLINNEIKFTYKRPIFELGQLYNLTLEVLTQTNRHFSLIKEFENLKEGELTIDLKNTEGFSRGQTSFLNFRLKDEAAGIGELFQISEELYRVNLPHFTKGSELTISPETVKPFSTKENLVLTNPVGYIDTGSIKSDNSKSFEYFFGPNAISIGKGVIKGTTAKKIIGVANSEDDKDVNKINLFINEYAEAGIYKSAFNTKYEVRLYDHFDNYVSLFNSNITDFKEPPSFEENDTVKHTIQYSLNNNQLVLKDSKKLKRMYNKDEIISLKFPKPSDYNKDMKEYEVYKANIIIDEGVSPPLEQEYSTLDFTLIQKQNYKGDETEIIELNVPYYENNCYTVVKIIAIDGLGQQSNPIYSDTHLIACRTGKPLIHNTDFEFDTTSNNFTPSLIVSDIGGSKLPNFTFMESYEQYPNFERADIPNREILLTLEVCANADFSGTIGSYLNSFTEKYDLINDYINKPFILGDKYKTLSQFYVRFNISISTGYDKTVEYTTPIQIFYNESPTISRRNHTVGINSKEFSANNDQALLISDYKNKKYITLSGTSDDGLLEKREVHYNLKTGKVIGGIIIDCGEW